MSLVRPLVRPLVRGLVRGLDESVGGAVSYYNDDNNLLTFPRAFDHPDWHKNSTASFVGGDNAIAAPDGTVTADRLTTTSLTLASHVRQTNGAVTGQVTGSVYLKQDDQTHITLRLFEVSGVDVNATFRFSDATFVTISAGLDATHVETLPNGWYRVGLTDTFSSAGNIDLRIGGENTTDTVTGTKTYLWNGALELGAVMTT